MNSNSPMLSRWRMHLFRGSVITCVLSAIGAFVCWDNPFPLIPWGVGGYQTNPWDERVFVGAVSTSLLTVILAVFGRGITRVLLILIGFVVLALSIFGFVSNHV
jgi:xanthine/uracil permease